MLRMADQVAGWFVMVVVATTLLTFFVWGFFAPEPSWVYGLINAVAVLIITCPCALGPATPMSIMVDTGSAAIQVNLFRDTAAIEHFRKVDTLIDDKTGTLTEGKPAFDRALAVEACRPTGCFTWRRAWTRAANTRWPTPSFVQRVNVASRWPSPRVSSRARASACAARSKGRARALDNIALMQQVGVVDAPVPQAEALRAEGSSVMHLAADGRLLGLLAVPDPVKARTPEALAALRSAGLRVVMATGDGLTTARAVSARLGIDEYCRR